MTRYPFLPLILVGGVLCLAAGVARSHDNEVKVTRSGGELCFTSNGLPPHDTGTFPNPGNPHTLVEQDNTYCVDSDPAATGRIDRSPSLSGVTLAGIPIRPGTADYYDASSPRGHSRDPSSGWNLEGMGSATVLGMDANAAHVDQSGLYHYHGVTEALMISANGTLIGYAADGFEIHLHESAASSWQLKSGTRSTAPFGAYDGSYEEDWVYVAGSGNLDECNGAEVNGRYVYFATETFPFFPRCFVGTVSGDFR